MAEQGKMGSDAKEIFAQMDEGRNVDDRVGVQIHQLNPIKMKKTSEKFTGWQSKSLIKEGFEDDHLTSVGGQEELPVAARHLMRDFSRRTLLVTIFSRSFSVTVEFIHTLLEIRD